jgi:hypothetical protein
MKNLFMGVLLLSLAGCASIEDQKQLSTEAEHLELTGKWWNNGREFDSLEEAKHFTDVLFVKIGQITKLGTSKGLNGLLKPAGADPLWTPADGKVSVNWDFRVSDREGHWLDLAEEQMGSTHSAILYIVAWYEGKGVIFSWYGIEPGWSFANNTQRAKWNDKTVCEYPVGFTKTRAWRHLGYSAP